MHPTAEPRATNRSVVLSRLLSGRILERNQLVESTGLSRATVFRVVDELRGHSLVHDAAVNTPSGRGRPSTPVEFDGSVQLVGGVDLGGTNCRFVVADALGVTKAHARLLTPRDLDGAEMGRWMAARLAELLASCQDGNGPLGAVAVGVPAVVAGDKSRVVASHNLPQLLGTDFIDTFRAEVGVPTTLDNDSNLALVGELQYGSLAEAETAVLLTLGTGLGSAIALDGRILSGPSGLLGEFGRLRVPGRDIRLRDLVSGGDLVHYARTRGFEIEHAQEIFADPDQYADLRAEIDDALVHLISIVGLAYEPRTVILAGGLAEGLDDDVLDDVQRTVLSVVGVSTHLRHTSLGDYAGLLGALAVALSDLYITFGVQDEHLDSIDVDRARIVKALQDFSTSRT